MKDRAATSSTFGSVGGVVIIFGLALTFGAGGSLLLEIFGWVAAVAGLAAMIAGAFLHFGAANRDRLA